MPVLDKTKIIEAVQQTEEEWVLFAINRLLLLDEKILKDEKSDVKQSRQEGEKQKIETVSRNRKRDFRPMDNCT